MFEARVLMITALIMSTIILVVLYKDVTKRKKNS